VLREAKHPGDPWVLVVSVSPSIPLNHPWIARTRTTALLRGRKKRGPGDDAEGG